MSNAPILVTASQVERLMKCSGGGGLLRVTDPAPAADEGTEDHERILMDPAQPSGHFLWDWVRGGTTYTFCSVECSMLWEPSVVDGRLINAKWLGPLVKRRGYPPISDRAIAGTFDAGLCLTDDTGLHIRIADLKTGHDQIYGGLPDPGESWQLRTLAVLWWAVWGFPDAVDASLAWACWDRENENGWMIEAPVARLYELQEWRQELVDLLDLVGPGTEFARGPWCRYCDSFDFCPPQREAIARILAGGPEPVLETPAAVEDYWLDLKAAERQIVTARESLTMRVDRDGAAPVGHGREIIAARNYPRRVIDIGRLKAMAGDRKVTRETATLESIRAGIGKDEAETFLSQAEQDGIIERRSTAPFLRERKIKP